MAPSPLCLHPSEASRTRGWHPEILGILTQSEQFQADCPLRGSSYMHSPRLIRIPETRPENRDTAETGQSPVSHRATDPSSTSLSGCIPPVVASLESLPNPSTQ